MSDSLPLQVLYHTANIVEDGDVYEVHVYGTFILGHWQENCTLIIPCHSEDRAHCIKNDILMGYEG